MACHTIDIRCPSCGAPASYGDKVCSHCYNPIVITSFNSVYGMPLPKVNKYAGEYKKILMEDPDNAEFQYSIAACYLKLKLYDKAIVAFEKAIENNFDNSETYFYAAVSLLRGKKAFLAKRIDIDKIEEYIQAANMIEPRGIYYYLLAYIKYDYFYRKSYKTSPDYRELLKMSQEVGVSDYDIEQLYGILGVDRPDCL